MGDRLRVSVLGPLSIHRGTAELPAGPPQQRALLAALVLRRGAPATTSELIDEIWGEAAPVTAVAVVRQYVHGLRRVLAGDPGLTIGSSPRGYAAEPAGDTLDLDVFERLVAEAGQARSAGRPETAAGRLREALALWRGPALAGVPGPGAELRRPVLAHQRLSALTARAGLDLELGRHREIQPELEGLVLAHPLDEHLRRLLMTALYRCGRQADALATYRDCCRLLADELGVDPGPELRELYLRVVRGDPELAGPPGGPALRPLCLPAAPAAFVGREETLRRAGRLLGEGGPGPVVVVLAGMGGIGKTTTALHWAHRVAPRYPDGQLHADLRGFGPGRDPASPAEVLDGFLRTLGVPAAGVPEHLPARAGLFRSLTAGRRFLLLLDNAASAETVRALMPGSGPSLVLVTSRGTLPGLLVHSGARLLNLRPPEHDEALALFAARVGPERVRAEPVAAREIVERSGRLPLALAVVAARAVAGDHLPLAAIAAELGAAHGTLTAFRTADPSADVAVVLSWSYKALAPAVAEAFRRLCLHPGPDLAVAAAASMLALQPRRAHGLLAELTAAALLTEARPGRWAIHDLVRSFGHELAGEQDDPEQRRTVRHRMLDHYVHTSWAAAHQLFDPRHPVVPEHPVDGVVPGDLEAADWFGTEHPTLLAALDLAAREGFDRHAWQLSWLVRDYLNRHGRWHDLQTSQLTGLAAATRGGEPTVEARVLWGLALVELNLGRYPVAHAHLRRALAIFTAAGDRAAVVITRRRIGYLLTEQGDFAAALREARLDLARQPAGTDAKQRADALNSIGWLCARLGRFEEAIDHAHRAMELTPLLRPYQVADIFDTLGLAQAGCGRADEAEESYRRAAEIYRDHGALFSEARTWHALGEARQRAGRTSEAEVAYAQAGTVLSKTDDPRAADLNRLLDACIRHIHSS